MSNVRIAGVGMTPFGDHTSRTSRELFGDAVREALDDATLSPDAVDELVYANFAGELTEHRATRDH